MVYQGNPVSEGIAMGKVMLYEPFVPTVDNTAIAPEEVPAALARYEAARSGAKKELDALRNRLMREDPQKAKIIRAQTDILFDVAMEEEIRDAISDGRNPEAAVDKIFRKYIKIIGKAADERIRERVSDLEDVKSRLLRNFHGIPEKNLAFLPEPIVVVAKDLFPDEDVANAKSIINVLALGLAQGEEVEVSAVGEDETQAVNSLIALIDSRFGE